MKFDTVTFDVPLETESLDKTFNVKVISKEEAEKLFNKQSQVTPHTQVDLTPHEEKEDEPR